VINNHIKNHPDITDDEKQESVLEQVVQDEEDIISQEMLKKYITYARKFIQPKLSDVDKEKISKFYAEIRKESTRVGGMLVSVRHIESLLRMAESHAKMHLREYVRSDDVDLAISILLKSFLMSQKYSVARALEKKFAPFLTKQQDTTQYLLHILDRMARDQVKSI
jgi:DNA replication licensing factor MCM2